MPAIFCARKTIAMGENSRVGSKAARAAKGRQGTGLKAFAQPPALDSDGHVEEAMWFDVIRKMDEVYSELVQHEIALEEKNRELERSQQFVYNVLSAMSDILLVCDKSGKVQQVNQAFLKLTGRSEKDLIGTSLAALLADQSARSRLCPASGSVSREGLQDFETQFLDADGASIPVALNCSPLTGPRGQINGMVLVGRPVGELRRAYQDLSEAHETLKRTQQQLIQTEKLASLGQLVAGVAHELNNPISFVVGNTFSLRRYLERITEYIDALHRGASAEDLQSMRAQLRIDHILGDLVSLIEGTIEGAERTRDIVDALKRFSAMDRGEDQLFDLAQVIERAVHWVTKAVSSTFTVQNDVSGPLLVQGSPGQIQQVIINLVKNAFDAAAASGSPHLAISQTSRNGWVEILFHDNGPGIAPEVITRIFDPFFTTKPIGKGTGLGLSISYGIVERHGGVLSAENHPQGGAAFRLKLPVKSTGQTHASGRS
jgi:two-component system sensor histidine kinase HupT/HoxJ